MSMTQPTPDRTEGVLQDLVKVLIDGRKGFAKAADLLSDNGHTDLAETMRLYSEQRQRFVAELREAASGYVTIDDEDGSAGAGVHRAWMSLADTVTGDDPHAVLAVAEQGEDHAKETYEEALADDLPSDVRTVVTRQAADVAAAHDEVRELRDRYAG